MNKLQDDLAAMITAQTRYVTDGISFLAISKELNSTRDTDNQVSESQVRDAYRQWCDDFDVSKKEHNKAKYSRIGARYRHIESRCDNLVEQVSDALDADTLEIEDIEKLTKISKLYADKANLAEGKATERIDGSIRLLPPIIK